MKDRLLTLLAALAALALVVFLLSPNANRQQRVSLPTTEDRGADGLKGLYTWLQRERLAVASLRQPYTDLNQDKSGPAHGNVLIVSLPTTHGISEQEWSALFLWLEKGNRLIVLGAAYRHPPWAHENCFCDAQALLARYRWTLQASDEPEIPEQADTASAESFQASIAALRARINDQHTRSKRLIALSSHPLLEGVQTLATQVTPELLKQPRTLAGTGQDNIALRLLQVENEAAVAAWLLNAGKGQIVLLLTPDLFSNAHLNHADNARFMSNLLGQALAPGARLWFDDYHFGLSERYDPEQFFIDARVHQTLACLLLFWLFYVAGYSTRLAPVRAAAGKRSAYDFIEVTAEFFARRLAPRLLAGELVKHLLADICRSRRLGNEAEAWAWLEKHGRIRQDQIRLLKKALSGRRIDLLALAGTLTEIRTITL